jgi:hypothetical protein
MRGFANRKTTDVLHQQSAITPGVGLPWRLFCRTAGLKDML